MKKRFLLAIAMAIALALMGGISSAAMVGIDGHKAYIYPVVRVTTNSGGGSGTVVCSRPVDGTYETYIITNNHVIASAILIKEEWDSVKKEDVKVERRSVVYVEIFAYRNVSEPTGTLKLEADILAYSEAEDLGLLKLRYDEQVTNIAKLPAPGLIYNVLDESISVGCSLLFPPLPATGVITRKNLLLESLPFDMSSSQIIFGNSGGAMFLADGTWIGVPSRVAATGWMGSVPITHMGLFISFSRVYGWLEKEGYGFVFKPEEQK